MLQYLYWANKRKIDHTILVQPYDICTYVVPAIFVWHCYCLYLFVCCTCPQNFIPSDKDVMVRVAFAESVAELALTAHRYVLDYVQCVCVCASVSV